MLKYIFFMSRYKIHMAIHKIRYVIDNKYKRHHDEYMIYLRDVVLSAYNESAK